MSCSASARSARWRPRQSVSRAPRAPAARSVSAISSSSAAVRRRVKGIVHDQSASGATLFVEPLSVVELNNTWTQVLLDEEREEERAEQRKQEGERRERDLRRAYMDSPNATEASWQAEKGALLARDREEQARANEAKARMGNESLIRGVF